MIQSAFRCVLVALCLVAFFPCTGFAVQAGEVGLVLSLTPGVNEERSGLQVALEQKSPVNTTDVLHTDATGRAQILFADDSNVSLGSNTTLALEDVVAEGKNPVFKARLGQGMARFITGKIVEQNPDGFAVVTPEATVGIRGTIFAVSSNDGKTTVYVMNTTRQVLVNGIQIPSGYKITLPDGAPTPMTPDDLNQVNGAMLARNTEGQNEEAAADDSLAMAGGNTVFNPDTLEQPELGTERIGDAMQSAGLSGPAYVTGTLTPASITGAYAAGSTLGSGSFSFTADMGSGAISNATMSNSHIIPAHNPGAVVDYMLTGGSGIVSGNGFKQDDYSYNGWEASARAIFKLPYGVELAPFVSFSQEWYEGPATTLETANRYDKSWRSGISLTWRFSEDWSVEAMYQHTDNRSRSNLYAYDQNLVSVGMAWSF